MIKLIFETMKESLNWLNCKHCEGEITYHEWKDNFELCVSCLRAERRIDEIEKDMYFD